ncbi:uncharacterized protein LOC108153694 [Drosophila miranda]|uniref:uncharacterized protein LOC108153694 n=1 Tax=Drosophila miranda TaxID=7229 RepID=UPI0007E761A2|nr:uncharacterized protein LOC108153694 [Drosophila miranda]XP_033242002.1 uncharacterized protein LOC108153694 [Drosophila miranda]
MADSRDNVSGPGTSPANGTASPSVCQGRPPSGSSSLVNDGASEPPTRSEGGSQRGGGAGERGSPPIYDIGVGLEHVSSNEAQEKEVHPEVLYECLSPTTGLITYSKRDPDDQNGEKESTKAAKSLEYLTIPKLLDLRVKKKAGGHGTEILRVLDLRTKETKQRDAERALRHQEHLRELARCQQWQRQQARAQEQQWLCKERLRKRQQDEAKAAKQLATLRKDIEHQIKVQKDSEAKWLRTKEERDREIERQAVLRKRGQKDQLKEDERRQRLDVIRQIKKERELEKRQEEKLELELKRQRERFMQHQNLHTEAVYSHPLFGDLYLPEYNSNSSTSTSTTTTSSTTFPHTASSCSSLMQNEMVSIPMANLNGGLKAASGPAGASATGGGVRYFSQFSKSATASTTTMVHQQQHQQHQQPQQQQQLLQRKATANGDLHANGRVAAFVPNGMRIKTEQQDMLLESLTVIKPDVITKTEATAAAAQTPPAVAPAAAAEPIEAAPVSDAPLALLRNQQQAAAAEADDPELDIVINNVVCSFSVRCHLKLRDIALRGCNVEYRRENGMVTMKLRRPYTTASIWSSGRITCTGATSEIMAKVAARRYARCLGKLGFPTRFQNFRIVNVLGTCSMPWAIKIVNFSEKHRDNASYEPELHPGVTYKMKMPKATLKIFSTGSVTVTAASVNDVESAIQHIYPLVHEFRKQRSPEELQHLRAKQNKNAGITGTPAAASTASTITDASETRVLQDQILTQSKTQSRSDILVNATAAHSKSIPGSAAGDLVNAAVCNVQRLKQIESYRQLSSQTQEERRHIPFPRDKSEAGLFPHSKPRSPPGDNICANARRRATECWATKLQNKRPRYNDPKLVAAGKTTTSTSTSSIASSTASSSSNPAIQSTTTISTTSASATTITGPILPLSSLTPIGTISGSRPFGLMAARTMIPATGTIIKIKQSCIKPLNRNALAAFTAASSGSIATAVNATATATANVAGGSAASASAVTLAAIKRERQLSSNSDLDIDMGWP